MAFIAFLFICVACSLTSESTVTLVTDTDKGTYTETCEVLEEPEGLKKEGYTFGGWYLDSSYNTPITFPYDVEGNVTIYAKWIINEYTVTFDVDGEKTTTTVQHGQKVTAPTVPTKEGYIFDCWTYNTIKYDFNTAVKENIYLIAKWSTNEYTVTFDVDGKKTTEKVEYGQKVTPPATPTKEGFTFDCWTLNGVKYDFSAVTKNITLVAKWNINEYTVTFDVDGVKTKNFIQHGQKVTAPTTQTKEGYTFDCWTLNGTEYNINTPVTGNIILVAKWNINKCTVTFDVDGVTTTATVDNGQKVTAPTSPTKEGHVFDCWTLNGIKYDFDTVVTENITLVAKWTVNKYTVTFDIDGTKVIYNINYGQKVTVPTTPTKEGHTFCGWSEIPDTMPAEDITITGSFEVNSYKAFFLVGNSVYAILSFNYGETITPPINPQKDGYIFNNWTNLPENMPAEDIVLIANFTENTENTGVYDVYENSINNLYYDLKGNRIKKTATGIYIINGKKIFIK